MATYAGKPSSFYSTTGGVPVEGAWYSGQRYLNGQLLAPGEYEPGKLTSNETISQTNPNNVQYVQQQREIQANQIQPPVNLNLQTSSQTSGLAAELAAARKATENLLNQQQTQNQEQTAEARARESEALKGLDTVQTPFREELTTQLRDQYGVEGDVQARLELGRQALAIYDEVTALIEQQKSLTGLAAVRNPRIQKTIDDGVARIGAYQAAVAMLDGNVSLANNEIDRAVGYIQADRQDRIDYYNTLLGLANRDILSLDVDSKRIANEQLNLLKNDQARAEASVDYIKQLMLNPSTAMAMAHAGVTINDSVEQINGKLAQYQIAQEIRETTNRFTEAGYTYVTDPSRVPANQLKSFTDPTGRVHYYKEPAKPMTDSQTVDGFFNDLRNKGNVNVMSDSGKEVSITQQMLDMVNSIRQQVVAPSFSAQIGTVYIDSYGTKWQMTRNGWIKI